MADLETFRSETRSWLEANAPEELRGKGNNTLEGVWGGRKATWAGPGDPRKLWLERCREKGWTTRTSGAEAPAVTPTHSTPASQAGSMSRACWTGSTWPA